MRHGSLNSLFQVALHLPSSHVLFIATEVVAHALFLTHTLTLSHTLTHPHSLSHSHTLTRATCALSSPHMCFLSPQKWSRRSTLFHTLRLSDSNFLTCVPCCHKSGRAAAGPRRASARATAASAIKHFRLVHLEIASIYSKSNVLEYYRTVNKRVI